MRPKSVISKSKTAPALGENWGRPGGRANRNRRHGVQTGSFIQRSDRATPCRAQWCGLSRGLTRLRAQEADDAADVHSLADALMPDHGSREMTPHPFADQTYDLVFDAVIAMRGQGAAIFR